MKINISAYFLLLCGFTVIHAASERHVSNELAIRQDLKGLSVRQDSGSGSGSGSGSNSGSGSGSNSGSGSDSSGSSGGGGDGGSTDQSSGGWASGNANSDSNGGGTGSNTDLSAPPVAPDTGSAQAQAPNQYPAQPVQPAAAPTVAAAPTIPTTSIPLVALPTLAPAVQPGPAAAPIVPPNPAAVPPVQSNPAAPPIPAVSPVSIAIPTQVPAVAGTNPPMPGNPFPGHPESSTLPPESLDFGQNPSSTAVPPPAISSTAQSLAPSSAAPNLFDSLFGYTTRTSAVTAVTTSGGFLADLFGTSAQGSAAITTTNTAPTSSETLLGEAGVQSEQAYRQSTQQAGAKSEQAYRESTQQAGAKSQQAYRESTQQAGAKSAQAYRESTQQAGAKSEQAYRESTQQAGAKSEQAYRESTQHAAIKSAQAVQESIQHAQRPPEQQTHKANHPQQVHAQTTYAGLHMPQAQSPTSLVLDNPSKQSPTSIVLDYPLSGKASNNDGVVDTDSSGRISGHTGLQQAGSPPSTHVIEYEGFSTDAATSAMSTGMQGLSEAQSVLPASTPLMAASLKGGPQQAVLGEGSSNAKASMSQMSQQPQGAAQQTRASSKGNPADYNTPSTNSPAGQSLASTTSAPTDSVRIASMIHQVLSASTTASNSFAGLLNQFMSAQKAYTSAISHESQQRPSRVLMESPPTSSSVMMESALTSSNAKMESASTAKQSATSHFTSVSLQSSFTVQSSSSAASASTVPLWGNCGGSNPGKCADGTTCVYQDQWYSQCKPSSASDGSHSSGQSQSQVQSQSQSQSYTSSGQSSVTYQSQSTQSSTRTQQTSSVQQSSSKQESFSTQSTSSRVTTSSTQSTSSYSQQSSFTQPTTRTSQSLSTQSTTSTRTSSTQQSSSKTSTSSSSSSTASVLPMWSPCGGSNAGVCASGSSCICKDSSYSQCRPQVGGSWAADSSWQCQSPGQAPSGSGSTGQSTGKYTPSRYQSSGSATGSATTGSQTGSQTGRQSGSSTGSSTGSQTGSKTQKSSSSGTASASASSSAILNNKYMGRNTTQGDCTNTQQTDGWHGVGATSRYGWMGSACQCGDKGASLGSAAWQANSSLISGIPKGFYSGAVNQQLFNGKLNDLGQPNCGSACGSCYQLQTTGSNTYGTHDAPNGGSTINMMVVDACYNPGDSNAWCKSNQAGPTDPHGCDVHFDIQTGADDKTAPNPKGADGANWAGAGDVVQYRSIPCPQAASDQYHQSCTSCG